jgi:hypothetical protein
MDDLTVEDDKKRFEPEVSNEEDSQPDPDEELMLDRGNGRVWLVKVSIDLIRLKHERQNEPHFLLCIFEESLSHHASYVHFERYLNT